MSPSPAQIKAARDRQEGFARTMPDGPYLLTVVRIEPEKITRAQHRGRAVVLRIMNTDYEVWWWITDSTNARWVWEDIVETWEDVDQMIGRTFLFEMYREATPPELADNNRGKVFNRVKAPLAEVISD